MFVGLGSPRRKKRRRIEGDIYGEHSVNDLVSLFSQDDSDSEVSDSDLAISLSNYHRSHFKVFQDSEY